MQIKKEETEAQTDLTNIIFAIFAVNDSVLTITNFSLYFSLSCQNQVTSQIKTYNILQRKQFNDNDWP
jgi:hypothetical protein